MHSKQVYRSLESARLSWRVARRLDRMRRARIVSGPPANWTEFVVWQFHGQGFFAGGLTPELPQF
jgi:hypothetical protein